jgi:hypothetical protein
MPGTRWTKAEEEAVKALWPRIRSLDQAEDLARRLHRTVYAVKNKAQAMGLQMGTGLPEIERPPSANRPLWQIVEDQIRSAAAKRAHHGSKHSGVRVSLKDDRPWVLALLGDPHVDDDGFDGALFARHTEACAVHGFHAVNLGDLTNNWVGRLGRLYAHQHTTDDEAMELCRWLLRKIPWVAVVLGNHDRWSPVAQLLCQEAGVPYVSHGAVFVFETPSGHWIKCDLRHDHRGRSMYHPAHGQARKSFRGSDCHVIAGAHLHVSAYEKLVNGVTGRTSHCVRVGSFKRWDDYADSKGLDRDDIGPAAYVVVDTSRPPEEDCAVVFHDPDYAALFRDALNSKNLGEKPC